MIRETPMANEIQADYASGHALYAMIRNKTGQVWHPAGERFEDWGADGHTSDDYDIPLTDRSGSRYVGSFDADIPSGGYAIQVFRQAGASPAETDVLVCSREILWTGTGELTSTKLLANKTIQDKLAEAVDYYDDDGQTILLTLTTSDKATTFTRTPE